MQVEVSDWARERIEALVAAGRVSSESQAVDCALAALDEADSMGDHDQAWWDRLAELDAVADDDVRLGRVQPADDAFFARLRARVLAAERFA